MLLYQVHLFCVPCGGICAIGLLYHINQGHCNWTFVLQIDASELDAKYAYIQVTHVTPYFEKLDLEERQTEFEQSHDIACFMFETPFTKDGKARGSPEDQWKRRTILTSNVELFLQVM